MDTLSNILDMASTNTSLGESRCVDSVDEVPKTEDLIEGIEDESNAVCNMKLSVPVEFDWMSFLDVMNRRRKDTADEHNIQPTIEAAPNSIFLHVESSLDGGVREGMIVEMSYNDNEANDETCQFWLARVDAVYGPLLKLSYVGNKDENKRRQIWHDLTKKRLFPLGYCQMNKCQLIAPEEIKKDRTDWEQLALQYLEDVTYDTLDMHHIEARNEGEGVTPIDRLRIGTVIELQDETKPDVFWPAIISSNHGGRLGLSYVVGDGWKADEGFIPRSHSDLSADVTLFYLSPRIFPKGHAKANKDKLSYRPPLHISNKAPNIDIKACLEWEDLAEGPPSDVFAALLPDLEKVPKPTKDAFKSGGEIEIIHPRTKRTMERALVVHSNVENYFLVHLIDDP